MRESKESLYKWLYETYELEKSDISKRWLLGELRYQRELSVSYYNQLREQDETRVGTCELAAFHEAYQTEIAQLKEEIKNLLGVQ